MSWAVRSTYVVEYSPLLADGDADNAPSRSWLANQYDGSVDCTPSHSIIHGNAPGSMRTNRHAVNFPADQDWFRLVFRKSCSSFRCDRLGSRSIKSGAPSLLKMPANCRRRTRWPVGRLSFRVQTGLPRRLRRLLPNPPVDLLDHPHQVVCLFVRHFSACRQSNQCIGHDSAASPIKVARNVQCKQGSLNQFFAFVHGNRKGESPECPGRWFVPFLGLRMLQ